MGVSVGEETACEVLEAGGQVLQGVDSKMRNSWWIWVMSVVRYVRIFIAHIGPLRLLMVCIHVTKENSHVTPRYLSPNSTQSTKVQGDPHCQIETARSSLSDHPQTTRSSHLCRSYPSPAPAPPSPAPRPSSSSTPPSASKTPDLGQSDPAVPPASSQIQGRGGPRTGSPGHRTERAGAWHSGRRWRPLRAE